MKGTLILVEVENPRPGMAVCKHWFTALEQPTGVYGIVEGPAIHDGFVDTVNKLPKDNLFWVKFKDGTRGKWHLSEMEQIVVERVEHTKKPSVDFPGQDEMWGHKKNCPLHPDDYEKAIPAIGEEIEFDIVKIGKYSTDEWDEPNDPLIDVAKLITSSNITYTEDQALLLAKNAYEEGCRIASPFGSQGLSRNEKANWPVWIHSNKKK